MMDLTAWAASLHAHAAPKDAPAATFTAWGVHFGVAAPDAVTLATLVAHVPLGWSPAPATDRTIVYTLWPDPQPTHTRLHLCVGRTPIARPPSLAAAVQSFQRHAEFTMALLARDALFVHAGVVGVGGRAILLPGRSFAGKTTLVQALVAAGATYYSDEYALLDRAGRVHPYPRPLAIRRDGTMHPTPVDALGGVAGTTPLPVGLIVDTYYRPGARWRPQVLTPGQALLALMANTVAAQGDPRHSMPMLRHAVADATGLCGPRGTARATAIDLVRRLSGVVAQEDSPS